MSRRSADALAAAGVFAALAMAMTWPLAWRLTTHAPQHHDVYFNMWRLRWIAHALATSPAHLFDANIFHPEPNTLALSDAILVEGLLAAPMSWARVSPVAIQNLMILLPVAMSGAAMFALARYLTGSRGAGLLAGIVFAFAPFRFEHLAHMEMQWAMWMPLAFLALHRLYDTGRTKYGVAMGACLALQLLSCIYYGIFLATLLPLAALLLFVKDRAADREAVLKALAAGAALALLAGALYARPFLRERSRVGERPVEEVDAFSARPSNYLVAPPDNYVYGSPSRPGRPERRLFPGALAVLLALVGLLLSPPSRRAIVYLLLLVAAFEASLGFSGYTYPFLYDHVPAYRGLRAMARLGIAVLLFLGVLAAYGYAALAAGRRRQHRLALVAALSIGLLLEYRTRIPLSGFAVEAPGVYRLLAQQPRGVVAELPVPVVDRLPGPDPEYAYYSTFHWFPLVNGYSGNYPPSYLARLERLRGFPDDTSLAQLQRDGVRYVVVHRATYDDSALDAIHAKLAASGMTELGGFDDSGRGVSLYVR